MKFTYVYQHKLIPNLNSQNGEFLDIITGGYFLSEDKKTLINLTSEFLIRENRDPIAANINYLELFFPIQYSEKSYYTDNMNSTNESSNLINNPDYIGKWNSNIDANANIYYIINENEINKVIFSKPIDLRLITDLFGVITIMEHNGNMFYSIPEEGDILFNNLKDARLFIKEKYKDILEPLT